MSSASSTSFSDGRYSPSSSESYVPSETLSTESEIVDQMDSSLQPNQQSDTSSERNFRMLFPTTPLSPSISVSSPTHTSGSVSSSWDSSSQRSDSVAGYLMPEVNAPVPGAERDRSVSPLNGVQVGWVWSLIRERLLGDNPFGQTTPNQYQPFPVPIPTGNGIHEEEPILNLERLQLGNPVDLVTHRQSQPQPQPVPEPMPMGDNIPQQEPLPAVPEAPEPQPTPNPPAISCTTCNKEFKSRTTLKQHCSTVHIGTTCYFPDCMEDLGSEEALRRHLRWHNSSGAESQPDGVSTCPWPGCGRQFKDVRELMRHLRKHNSDAREAAEAQAPGS
ncbi:hypothetical protein F4805DRAFT_475434 [Annulohypoxylon moriforme]|nr:hypothetical protein F4805DRAFT_475434 [Annulohypoxylon moriforme]